MEEKKIIKKFMKEVHTGKGLGIYGIFDVVKSLQNGMVDTVIVTRRYRLFQNRCKMQKMWEHSGKVY